jgi:hypothetical protein
MKYLLALIITLYSVPGLTWSDWTPEQRNWYVASNVAIMADWSTTRDLSRRYHEGYHEINPVLGRRPSTSEVDQYFIGAIIAHYFIADWLPNQHRTFYLKTVTVVEGALVAHNLSIGLHLRF